MTPTHLALAPAASAPVAPAHRVLVFDDSSQGDIIRALSPAARVRPSGIVVTSLRRRDGTPTRGTAAAEPSPGYDLKCTSSPKHALELVSGAAASGFPIEVAYVSLGPGKHEATVAMTQALWAADPALRVAIGVADGDDVAALEDRFEADAPWAVWRRSASPTEIRRLTATLLATRPSPLASRAPLASEFPSETVEEILSHMENLAEGECVITLEDVASKSRADVRAVLTAIVCLHEELEDRQQRELAARHDLESTHELLVTASRRAGMAEVAASVLHNVGNVLNSVNVATATLHKNLRDAKDQRLRSVLKLLNNHQSELGPFFTDNPRGKLLLSYLERLIVTVERERQQSLEELERVGRGVEHMKQIISSQQSYARGGGASETFSMAETMDMALELSSGSFKLHGIDLEKRYARDVPALTTDRHRVLQIVTNLINNARHAVREVATDRRIVLSIDRSEAEVVIQVADNGCGFGPEVAQNLFRHGFTTKKDGHGFGLHGSAIAAGELGGSLTARSDGPGCGATFVLTLPLENCGGPRPQRD
jgi:signal transduction histidine kinase